jgi:hypothetical protein
LGLLPLLASNIPCQEEAVDRDAEVAKAIEHRRFAVRRAVAGKLAQAGDEAVPAIRRYEAEHGRQKIPLILVDAIARSGQSGEATLELLLNWAEDRDFYWRSQALGGLALRKRSEHSELFREALVDPAHLYRIEGARGLLTLALEDDRSAVHARLEDVDPRVRLRVGILLIESGDDAGLPTIAEAIGREDRFLDDPWGARSSARALRALHEYADDDFGFSSAEGELQQATALMKAHDWIEERIGRELQRPKHPADDRFIGGLELRSCRNGDLFMRWDLSGQVVLGLEGSTRLQLDPLSWRKVSDQDRSKENKIYGPVICDYLRLIDVKSNLQQKVAPGSLPPELATWLDLLSQALQNSGHEAQADALRSRLTQFVRSQDK